MRKLFAIALAIVLLAAATITASPWISDKKLEWDCPESELSPSEDCLKRMRAAGHMWSGVGKLTKAENWYLRGSKSDDPIAMFHLAWVYEERAAKVAKFTLHANLEKTMTAPMGILESEDFDPNDPRSLFKEFALPPQYHELIDQAEFWYRRSATKGFAPSMNNLAQIYSVNPVRKPDYETALRLHRAAAIAGNPVAHWNVGMTCSSGKGATRDPNEAENWWTWTPDSYDPAQFRWPVLERTRFFGSAMPQTYVTELRHNAKHGLAVTMRPRQLQPNASLRGSEHVQKELQRRAVTKE